MLQWLNPCEVLRHVQMAAVGVRPGAYWSRLLVSHAVAWGLLGLASALLPHACRWQSSVNAGRRSNQRRWWNVGRRRRSSAWRSRLLGRNPFHWLTSREVWPTASVWLWLAIIGLGWAGLGWMARNAGTLIYYVIVLAAGGVWFIALLTAVPVEASRRLVEDRQNGVLEMMLCTPLSVREIVRGQWLSLRRRFLPPVLAVMVADAGFMTAGYVTLGFGGMLDPEDRGMWLFMWSAGIVLLPLYLTTLSWVAMRRALFARNAGEAGGLAVMNVLVLPGFGIWGTCELVRWAGWNLGRWETMIFIVGALLATLLAFAWNARRVLLANLREAAASRYAVVPPAGAWPTMMQPLSSPISR